MFQFDPSKLTHKFFLCKMITTSGGGSMLVVDTEKTKKNKKETYNRVDVNEPAVRHFRKITGASKFLTPVVVCAFYYDDRIVSVRTREKMYMTPEESIALLIEKCEGNNWYTDGVYVFSATEKQISDAIPVTADGKFRAFRSLVHPLHHLGGTSDLVTIEVTRSCVGYFADNGQYAFTSPVWSDFARTISVSNKEEPSDALDSWDAARAVNLNFALKAGGTVSKIFGFRSIEPLNLPSLMTDLRTVNLPNVDPSIRKTMDIGMSVKQAMAWLIGMTKKTTCPMEHYEISRLINLLLRTGCFVRETMTMKGILKDGVETFADIPLKTIEEAAAVEIDVTSMAAVLSARRAEAQEAHENSYNGDF